MNLRRKKNITAEVSTSSMNDIMFFLMLFFLIMSTLLNPSVIKLSLPNSKHSQAIRTKEIQISVTKDLAYYVNNKPIAFDQIENSLKAELQKSTDATVVLRCDNTLPIQELVNLLEIGNKLQIRMILATKTTNGTTN
ncbi:MAG: biopolymer transporter ExbD [Bacteroidota bacterium]